MLVMEEEAARSLTEGQDKMMGGRDENEKYQHQGRWRRMMKRKRRGCG